VQLERSPCSNENPAQPKNIKINTLKKEKLSSLSVSMRGERNDQGFMSPLASQAITVPL